MIRYKEAHKRRLLRAGSLCVLRASVRSGVRPRGLTRATHPHRFEGVHSSNMRRFLIALTVTLILIASIGVGVAVALWLQWQH
jgi:hypothetical protein